jgi:hypothetical protein
MPTTISHSLTPSLESQIMSGTPEIPKHEIPKSILFFGTGVWVLAMLFISFLTRDLTTTWPLM